MVEAVIFFGEIGRHRARSRAHRRIDSREILLVLRVEKLPPKALHSPWGIQI